MAYEVKFTDNLNKGSLIVDDNTINQETSVKLPGRNSSAYGTAIAENFLHLLENFANRTEPTSPVEGQIWYDNTPGVNQLKVYDGTTWTSSGGLKKGITEPDVSNSITGDLWVDTDNQQLYLFSGSGWILVGPEFSDGLITGIRPLTITGTNNNDYTVLVVEIEAEPAAIISTSLFTPKISISGYNLIKPGINFSSTNITGDGLLKLNGVAEQAESLLVNNQPVLANNFLRTDVDGIMQRPLKIKNDSGLQIGQNGQFSVQLNDSNGVIRNASDGSAIDFKVTSAGVERTVVSISGNKLGVNNLAATEALDVTGNIKASGNIIISGTEESETFGTGALVVNGGVGIAKNLNIGGELTVNQALVTSNIVPDTNNNRNLGTPSIKWGNVYSTTFYGNLVGDVVGTMTGKASTADKLASATTFRITGDLTTSNNDVIFDGSIGGTTKEFVTKLSDSLIANKKAVPNNSSVGTDEILLYRIISGEAGLYKTSKTEFLSRVPTNPPGVILPYAGTILPDGWLFCDGAILLKDNYPTLYAVIGDAYGETGDETLFALPDLRGRFPLGLDNMNGEAAGNVTGLRGEELGNTGGSEDKQINVENLPEHQHDLKADDGTQFYAIADGLPSDPSAITYNTPTGTGGQALSNSGGVASNSTGQAIDIMNPFLALNYIIYIGDS